MSVMQKDMTIEQKERLETIRHSTSHVMAEAVLKLFPGSKVAIGPSIENGFYYDFELTRPITQEDLPAIEKEMRKILSSNKDFQRKELSRVVQGYCHAGIPRSFIGEAGYQNGIRRHCGQEPIALLVRNLNSLLSLIRTCTFIQKHYGNAWADYQKCKNRKTEYERFPAHYLTAIASISTLTPRGRAAA